jgi:hypothetical protein
MWIRKSDSEIQVFLDQKELQKKSLKRPLIFGTVFGFLFFILTYFGFRGGTRGFYVFSQPFGLSQRTLSAGVFGFILFFGLAYYHQKKGSSFFSGEKFLRCDACHELSPTVGTNLCRCGGRLEPSEYYTWEE